MLSGMTENYVKTATVLLIDQLQMGSVIALYPVVRPVNPRPDLVLITGWRGGHFSQSENR